MASIIQRVAVHAMRTFTNFSTRETFQENLNRLRSYFQQVQASDLNFDLSLVTSVGEYRDELNEAGERVAPVTYLHLYEDHVFTMGIFVLKHGVRLPLHDHPGMYGVIKVIHGTAVVTSYNDFKNKTPPEEITRHLLPHQRHLVKSVVKNATQHVTPHSPTCVLSPEEGNFHEIHAREGPLAFVDILAPPYDQDSGSRQCHYYKELVFTSAHSKTKDTSDNHLGGMSNGRDNRILDNQHGAAVETSMKDSASYYLIRVPQPREFWCDTAEYQGPEINPYDENDSSV